MPIARTNKADLQILRKRAPTRKKVQIDPHLHTSSLSRAITSSLDTRRRSASERQHLPEAQRLHRRSTGAPESSKAAATNNSTPGGRVIQVPATIATAPNFR